MSRGELEPCLFTRRPLPMAQVPLAERMRPRSLDEVVGQRHLLGPQGTLRRLAAAKQPCSAILHGPPGSGKTTLARLLAAAWQLELVTLSATQAGVAEVRALAAEAQRKVAYGGGRTCAFIDEIHRFNRTQQDALLPHVEAGRLLLLGATTENPSFVIQRALASRCRLFALEPLTEADGVLLLARALGCAERGLGQLGVTARPAALEALARVAQGDVRGALGALEMAATLAVAAGDRELTGPEDAHVRAALDSLSLGHDRAQASHYDLLSALIKSMRRGEGEEATYYLARLVEGGEPADVIWRRLIIFAAEDVGGAAPMALVSTNTAAAAYERVGLPEGKLLLTHAVRALSAAPKCRRNADGYAAAVAQLKQEGPRPVPAHLRNVTHPRAW